jgi:hypothetical protein
VVFTLAVAAALVLTAVLAAGAAALPPKPPSAAKTRTAITKLKVAAPLSMSGYSRKRFRHWIQQSNGCDTREVVLKRDGKDVRTGAKCKVMSGTWTSYYDGLTITTPSKIDIDHIVPLAEAWRSGARAWTDERREAFANDLDDSQLIAVSATSNRSKSDQAPDKWKPPRRAAWCLYSRWWVQVKRHWRLTVTVTERVALQSMVATC